MEWKHDHVHVLFRAHPKSGISKFINACKSAGGTLLSVIKQYIESQGENDEQSLCVSNLPKQRTENPAGQNIWLCQVHLE